MSRSMYTVQRSLVKGARSARAMSENSARVTPEPLRLLLDEAARARGAHVVHGGKGDLTVADPRELRVLAADLDDGVHTGLEEDRGPGVGGDLVDLTVGLEHLADHLPSRPCRADPQEPQVPGE